MITWPHHRRQGFTLIELMVVVAVALLVLTLAAPSVRDLIAMQRLQGVHATLVTDLQFARSEAIRRNLPLVFRIDSRPEMTCYVLYADGVSGSCDCRRPPGQACTGNHEEIRSVQVPIAQAVAIAASSSRQTLATFQQSTGYSSPGDLVIDVTGAQRGAIRVLLNETGHVRSCTPDDSLRQFPPC